MAVRMHVQRKPGAEKGQMILNPSDAGDTGTEGGVPFFVRD